MNLCFVFWLHRFSVQRSDKNGLWQISVKANGTKRRTSNRGAAPSLLHESDHNTLQYHYTVDTAGRVLKVWSLVHLDQDNTLRLFERME